MPDDVKVILLHVIAPLHCKIQTIEHFTEFFVRMGANWWVGKDHVRVLNKQFKAVKVDLSKLPLSGNALMSPKYSRPVLGYTGGKLETMAREHDTWLEELLTSDTFTIFFAGEVCTFPARLHPSAVGGKIQHPKYAAAKGVMKMLYMLLGWVNDVNPTAEVVGGFRKNAVAWGQYVVKQFPEYGLKPYEHFLVCHMWEQMEHFGGVGRLSEIVCEASNAVFKNQHQRHQSGGSTTHSGSALVNVVATTDPRHVHRDLLDSFDEL